MHVVKHRTGRPSGRRNAIRAGVVGAAVVGVAAPLLGDIGPDGGVADPRAYVISTSGATALGALTRGATTNSSNFPTGEQNGLWRLGIDGLQIGRSTYTFGSAQPLQLIGYRDFNSVSTGEIGQDGENVRNHDHFVYSYHEVGSINGVLETVKSGGLWKPAGLANPSNPSLGYNKLAPDTPSQSAPLWRMGWPQIDANNYVVNATGTQATTAGGRPAAPQPLVRIGYSDVRSFQVFSLTSPDAGVAASPDRRPVDVSGTAFNDVYGYGKGAAAYNPRTGSTGTNFQRLADRSSILGEETGITGDSHLRNESIAVVPFAMAANPGTGLTQLREAEVKFLNAAGRLPNGADFNTVTREIGSGTRNQGANNVNLDPSWAGGERDRRSLATGNVAEVDVDGNAVTVRPGDEINPAKDLFGVDASSTASQQPKEHRVGPQMRFSDKSSGGSGVRPTVVNNRMSMGILSTGDVGDRGIAGTAASRTDPMRVLGIGWDEQAGEANGRASDGGEYVQPTAEDVTTGRYQMWSAAQAITVIGVDTDGDGTPDGYGTASADNNPNRPIHNDEIDHAGSAGTHRKFLDNINGSVSTFGQANQNSFTPADAVINASFIPPQIMKALKDFDGGVQTARAPLGNTTDPARPNYDPDADGLSDFDPDGDAGPAISTDALYDRLVVETLPGNLKARLNWADPAAITGNINEGQNEYRYKIFAEDVPRTRTTGTKEIPITARTSLAGDMNNDSVRDLADVQDLARAYAASEARGPVAGATPADVTFGSQTMNSDDLIVLTDFDGSGNISGTDTAPVFRAVDRNDVRNFLYGATVDTGGRSLSDPSYRYTGDDGTAVTSPSDAQRREDGVRLGRLRKNEAVVRFNKALDDAGAAASLKFDRFDVNGDGFVDRRDARAVDSVVGSDFRNLGHTLVAAQRGVDLVAAELNDDAVITHTDSNAGTFDGTIDDLPDLRADSDFRQMRNRLASQLLDGDADFDGRVGARDVLAVRRNFAGQDARWSTGDFDFNGRTNYADYVALRRNLGRTASEGDGTPGQPAAVALLRATSLTGSAPDGTAGGNASLVVNVDTGEVRIAADGGVILSGYEIFSEAGGLDAGGWQSLAGAAEGDWIELAALTQSISEADLSDAGFAVDRDGLSLGTIFKTGLVSFTYSDAAFNLHQGTVTYVPEPGAAGALLAIGGLALLGRRGRRR